MSFDPATIQITNHALERWCERRETDPEWAEQSLRAHLGRCAHKNPPLQFHSPHPPGRRYVHGAYVFVTDADGTVLRTILQAGGHRCRAVDRNRNERRARRWR